MSGTTTFEVKKAKLVDEIFLEVEYTKIITTVDLNNWRRVTENKLSEECRQPVHKDLVAAFDAIIPHLPLLCEVTAEKELLPLGHVDLESFKVTSFSKGGSDEHAGVTIVGRKRLKGNRILNLVAPFTKWEEENNPYQHRYELKEAIRHLSDEIHKYLFEGKVAPAVQMELQLEIEQSK